MTTLEILLQGEAIQDVQLIVLPSGAGHIEILAAAAEFREPGYVGEFLIFVEESDTPLKHGHSLPRPPRGGPLGVHVHRSRLITVEAHFNGRAKEIELSPARTVGAAKTLIATRLFGMTAQDAAEHVLQLSGTTDRPDIDTHIGTLSHHRRVRFDLVPLVRVEG